MKKQIKLNESALNSIIESVINEITMSDDMTDGYNDPNLLDNPYEDDEEEGMEEPVEQEFDIDGEEPTEGDEYFEGEDEEDDGVISFDDDDDLEDEDVEIDAQQEEAENLVSSKKSMADPTGFNFSFNSNLVSNWGQRYLNEMSKAMPEEYSQITNGTITYKTLKLGNVQYTLPMDKQSTALKNMFARIYMSNEKPYKNIMSYHISGKGFNPKKYMESIEDYWIGSVTGDNTNNNGEPSKGCLFYHQTALAMVCNDLSAFTSLFKVLATYDGLHLSNELKSMRKKYDNWSDHNHGTGDDMTNPLDNANEILGPNGRTTTDTQSEAEANSLLKSYIKAIKNGRNPDELKQNELAKTNFAQLVRDTINDKKSIYSQSLTIQDPRKLQEILRILGHKTTSVKPNELRTFILQLEVAMKGGYTYDSVNNRLYQPKAAGSLPMQFNQKYPHLIQKGKERRGISEASNRKLNRLINEVVANIMKNYMK